MRPTDVRPVNDDFSNVNLVFILQISSNRSMFYSVFENVLRRFFRDHRVSFCFYVRKWFVASRKVHAR